MCSWGLGVWNHLQHQPWLGWASHRNLGPDWNISLLKVTFTSKGTKEGMELPAHYFRSVLWYTYNAWQLWLRSGGMASSSTLTLIGLNNTKEFGPKLKSQPEGQIYVQGYPGRYAITCSLFQKCFMICRQCLTVMVEVWGSGITCNINLDWIEHYPGILGPNWNLSLPKVTFMSKGAQEGMKLPAHCFRSVVWYTDIVWQVWLRSWGMELPPTSTLIGSDITTFRILGLSWNLSPPKVTLMSKGTQAGMELPAHCFRSVVWYTDNIGQVWLRSEGMASPVTPTLIGSDITQDFGPRLKSQPPKGHIYVQGCPGRYGITCSLFRKCCMIHIHCLTGVVGVLRYGITPNINLDWIRHYI